MNGFSQAHERKRLVNVDKSTVMAFHPSRRVVCNAEWCTAGVGKRVEVSWMYFE